MCTDFILPNRSISKKPVVISGRTIDFATPLDAQICKVPRKMENVSSSPRGPKNGLEWKSKYGFIGFSYQNSRVYLHCINEQGLSVGSLYCAGTRLRTPETIKPVDYSKCLNVVDVTNYLCGTTATVEEAQKKLEGEDIIIWCPEIYGNEFHFAIHDASGNSIVVEFVEKAELRIYNNDDIRVLTNDPFFDWQSINLNLNYNSLTNMNSDKDELIEGFIRNEKGQLIPDPDPPGGFSMVWGSGMYGLPGDSSAVSRFVRVAKLLESIQDYDERVGIQYAMQVLSRVSVVTGEIKENPNNIGDKPPDLDKTQLAIVGDLTNKALYFRTDLNHNYQGIMLKELDFGDGVYKEFPAVSDNWYNDSTSKLQS